MRLRGTRSPGGDWGDRSAAKARRTSTSVTCGARTIHAVTLRGSKGFANGQRKEHISVSNHDRPVTNTIHFKDGSAHLHTRTDPR